MEGDAIHVQSAGPVPDAPVLPAARSHSTAPPPGVGAAPAGGAAVPAQPEAGSAAPAENAADFSAPVEPGVAYYSGDEQSFPTDKQFEIPDGEKIVGQVGSFAALLQPGWEKESEDAASFFEIGETGPRLYKDENFLRFEFDSTNGPRLATGANIDAWQPAEPHVLAATWGEGRLSLYVDGQLAAQQNYAQDLTFESGPALVGSNVPEGWSVAPGVLSKVQLYQFALGASDAANLATKLTGSRPAHP